KRLLTGEFEDCFFPFANLACQMRCIPAFQSICSRQSCENPVCGGLEGYLVRNLCHILSSFLLNFLPPVLGRRDHNQFPSSLEIPRSRSAVRPLPAGEQVLAELDVQKVQGPVHSLVNDSLQSYRTMIKGGHWRHYHCAHLSDLNEQPKMPE